MTTKKIHIREGPERDEWLYGELKREGYQVGTRHFMNNAKVSPLEQARREHERECELKSVAAEHEKRCELEKTKWYREAVARAHKTPTWTSIRSGTGSTAPKPRDTDNQQLTTQQRAIFIAMAIIGFLIAPVPTFFILAAISATNKQRKKGGK